ncbi:GAF domain-containing protein [Spongisporangium articulatum]|uniref:GAF domain-containing protein n=1 Tax=Spongisporangium articulatum TaxID=3362603 RepID=A0ABW8AL00_9ACTN
MDGVRSTTAGNDSHALATIRPPQPMNQGLQDVQLNMLLEQARRATGTEFAALNVLRDDLQVTVASAPAAGPLTIGRTEGICGRILCAMTGLHRVFATPDAGTDPDLHDSPWVSGEIAAIRFYVGASLTGSRGELLGTLCAFSLQSTTFARAEAAAMRLASVRDCLQHVLDARWRDVPGTDYGDAIFGPLAS